MFGRSANLHPHVGILILFYGEGLRQGVVAYDDVVLARRRSPQVEVGRSQVVEAVCLRRVVAVFHFPCALNLGRTLFEGHTGLLRIGECVAALNAQLHIGYIS